MTSFIDAYVLLNSEDDAAAKYKVGDHVSYTHPNFSGEGKILALACTGDGFEYAITDAPFLLWEEEIN